jgi:hypothetical protein
VVLGAVPVVVLGAVVLGAAVLGAAVRGAAVRGGPAATWTRSPSTWAGVGTAEPGSEALAAP